MGAFQSKKVMLWLFVIAMIGFLAWRFVRPMNIFVVSDNFKYPVNTDKIPAILGSLKSSDCGQCHQEFYQEWSTSIHSQAWTDPYFQADWRFDGEQQICKNCHTPLDKQQEHRVLGFYDKESFRPILEENPDFDASLQHEGVNCAGCHLREGKILGPFGLTASSPHPVEKMGNPNTVCMKCHVVGGKRWDTFLTLPPCGTVAEINPKLNSPPQEGRYSEAYFAEASTLGCVECHMPMVERPLVKGGEIRKVRQHLWRGGHDPNTVKKALKVDISTLSQPGKHDITYKIVLTNIGARHYFPTGTPDRHLTLEVQLLDMEGQPTKEAIHVFKRYTIWRPFIIDYKDTRLRYLEPREYRFSVPMAIAEKGAQLSIQVTYSLLDEKRRKRINYRNKEPIHYEIFHKVIDISSGESLRI